MTRDPPSRASGEATPGPRPRRIAWQLVQVTLLAALLLVGMYEVDLDARSLAERRARSALLAAVESASGPGTRAPAGTALEEAIESYRRVCGECAAPARCEETVRSIRVERRMPAGRGPCKVGIFERWNGDAR